MSLSIVRTALVLCALLLLAPTPLAQSPAAQDPGVRPVTRTFAITNARVVQAPGRELERATVVVRDGLITAVGPDARVPVDAEIIEGDTLVVYAGFIDGLGTAGVKVPAPDAAQRIADPMDAPRDRTGVLPDRLTRHHLDPTDASIQQLRRAGFTVAHVAPAGGLFSGQSVVILLAGDRADDLILARDVALVARFDGAAGVYPSTPMGVAAVMRDRYRQAAQARDAATRYAQDPAGRRRPAFDPVAEALLPSLEGRQPVFFVTPGVLEGQRALRLADEIGFPIVLAGVPESSILIDRLRQRGTTVLAPLALPDTVAVDTTLATDPTRDLAAHLGGRFFVTERRTRSYLDVEEETAELRTRRAISVALFERNPQTLQEAGVPFAFASLGESPGDFRANLRRMVERGLTREQALDALTTTPAGLLGLERSLGTVEAGKLANLVITDGDYFDADSRVRYVFVDGHRFEITPPTPDADPDAVVAVIGQWDFTLVTPDQPLGGRLVFTGTPDDLSGTMSIPELGTLQIESLRLEGNRLTFVIPNTPVGTINASGIITGNTMDAELSAPGMPPFSMTATRRPNN